MYHNIYLDQFKQFLTVMRDRTDKKLASDDSIYGITPFTASDENGNADFEKGCCIGFTILTRLSQKQGKLESWHRKLQIINDWSGNYDDLKTVVTLNGKAMTVKAVFEHVMERIFTIQDKISALPEDPDQYLEAVEQEYIDRKGHVAHLRGDMIRGHFTNALLTKYFACPAIQALYARNDVMMLLADRRHITTQAMENGLLEHFDINIDPENDPKTSVSKNPSDIAESITYHLNNQDLGGRAIYMMMQWLYIGDIDSSEGVSALSAAEQLEHEYTLDQLKDIEMEILDIRSFEEVNGMAKEAMNDFFASLNDEELYTCIYGLGDKCKSVDWVYGILNENNYKRLLAVTRTQMFEEFTNPKQFTVIQCFIYNNMIEVQEKSHEDYIQLGEECERILAGRLCDIISTIRTSDKIPDERRFGVFEDILFVGFTHRKMIPWTLEMLSGRVNYKKYSTNYEKALKKEGLDEAPGKALMACFAFLHRSPQKHIDDAMELMLFRTIDFLKGHPVEQEEMIKLFRVAVKVFDLEIMRPELKGMSVVPKKVPARKGSVNQAAGLFKAAGKKRVATEPAAAKRVKK